MFLVGVGLLTGCGGFFVVFVVGSFFSSYILYTLFVSWWRVWFYCVYLSGGRLGDHCI